MQCYKDKLCWCVDPFTGVVTPNTVGPPGTVHCRYDPPCVRQQVKALPFDTSNILRDPALGIVARDLDKDQSYAAYDFTRDIY